MRVHDSQAYRKMVVTRERISCILEQREVLLSFQTGFNFVNAAVVYAILESISGLEPSSVITEPRYLKLVPQDATARKTIFYSTLQLKRSYIRNGFNSLCMQSDRHRADHWHRGVPVGVLRRSFQ